MSKVTFITINTIFIILKTFVLSELLYNFLTLVSGLCFWESLMVYKRKAFYKLISDWTIVEYEKATTFSTLQLLCPEYLRNFGYILDITSVLF